MLVTCCSTRLGQGHTTRFAGQHAVTCVRGRAYTLADELAAGRTDPETAFRRCETRHRTLVDPRQRGFAAAGALLIPATRRGITVRNMATRLFPIMTAAGSLRRRLRPA